MSQPSPLRSFMLCLATRPHYFMLSGFLLTLTGCQNITPPQDNAIDSALITSPSREWNSNTRDSSRKGMEAKDIWERIRNGYKLQQYIGNNPRVDQQRFGLASRPDSIRQIAERSGPYIHYIVERLEHNELPLELALLPMIESSYNPLAYSSAQAAGLWQFIPSTGKTFNLRQTTWYDGRRDITASTNAAIMYLQRLHDIFNGDWLLALAAYNAGEGTVSRAIERNTRQGLPTDYWNLPLPRETQDYVPKLLALSQIINSPTSYNVNLTPIANQPYFEKVQIRHQLDLAKVADLANMDENELFQLNPAFKQRITMDGPQHVLVPVEKADELNAKISSLPAAPLPIIPAPIAPATQEQRKTYVVRKVDNLNSIANRFGVSANTLRKANNLRGNNLKTGQTLVIPSEKVANNTKTLPASKIKNESKSTSATQKNKLSANPVTAKTKPNKAPQQHIVRNGDTVWTIARRYDIPVKDIQRLNPKLGTQLKNGQTVTLPATVKR